MYVYQTYIPHARGGIQTRINGRMVMLICDDVDLTNVIASSPCGWGVNAVKE